MNYDTTKMESEDIRLLNLLKGIKDLDSDDTLGLLMAAKQFGTTSSLASWIEREKPTEAAIVIEAFNMISNLR